jgi:MYXO-CTERM domain-containing protein
MKRAEWLWWALAAVWSLLLVQALFPPDSHPHRNWVVGGLIWAAGMSMLVALGVRARRKRSS